MRVVRVQREDFDVAAETHALTSGRVNVGAVATFVGLCRDEEGKLRALEIEHYSGMAEAEIARVAAEAESRWPLLGLVAIHRYGVIRPGEQIVMVAAASSHRAAAFAAAEMLMDYLKTRAPFWKRALLTDGTGEGWLDAKEADDAAAERWRDLADPERALRAEPFGSTIRSQLDY
ncbi:MAG: molybdenum cofactor biosynthesis protein MoaE [Xanthobacteraceae bacterium]